ncbi:hypothetical protein QBC37DRAFT_308124 [Rhypophila decipiens]|uniref:Uncharacterized protein n=1 Tax=Rhypophila decipiens TaxID=261697 RepID=A0AAN6YJG0_9PEZI|nr:hypothetical protein QBC37DRAFT_308124 [Rhypophila decipiens]
MAGSSQTPEPESPPNAQSPTPGHVPTSVPKAEHAERKTPVNGSTYSFPHPLESPTCWREHGSEFDIELETLTIPGSATYSTDRLIPRPTPSVSESLDHNRDQPSNDQARHQQESKTQPKVTDRIDVRSLNYKPTALRWPFSVLLLSVMAGLFAFLEYQAQHLLPTNYTLLQVSHPTAFASLGNSGDYQANKASSDTTLQTVATTPQPEPASITRWNRAKLAPDPDPRPPEQSYPKPFHPFDAYCGWAAPRWTVETYAEYSTPCVPQLEPDNVECFDGKITVWLMEIIETFITNDPSWCPCRIILDILFEGDRWNMGPGLPAHSALLDWDTADSGCKSAMLAIASLNEYKVLWSAQKTSTIHTRGAAFVSWSSTGVAYPQTPPLASDVGFAPLWMYATTDAKGNVLIPLVSRVAGIDPQDVFGNEVHSTETALFPERWRPKEWHSTLAGWGIWVDNPCWSSQPCTLTPEVTDLSATVWWTFPLSMPDRVASSTGSGSSQPSASSTTTTATGIASTGSKSPDSSQPKPSATIELPPSRTSSSMTTTTSSAQTSPSATRGSISKPGSVSQHSSLPEPESTSNEPESTSNSQHSPFSTESLLQSTSSQAPASTTRRPSKPSSVLHHSSSLPEPVSISTSQQFPSSSDSKGASQPSRSSPEPGAASQHSPSLPDSESTVTLQHSPSSPEPETALQHSRSSPELELTSVHPSLSPENMTHDTSEEPLMSSGILVLGSHLTSLRSQPSLTNTASRTSAEQQQVSNNNTKNIVTSTYRNQRPSIGDFTSTLATSDTPMTPSPSPSLPVPVPVPLPPKGPIPPGTQSLFFNLSSESAYLMVSVVPVLLATLLLVLLQVMTNAINSILPFRALVHPEGALPEDSLLLSRNPSIFSSPFIAARFWGRFQDPLPLIGGLLSLLATVLVTLSSEVVRLVLTTDCGGDHHHSVRVCAFGLRKSNLLRAAEGLLGCLAVLAIVVAVVMWRCKATGLADDPWSIEGMAGLVRNGDGGLVGLLRSVSAEKGKSAVREGIERSLQGRRFRLGITEGTCRYGIEVVPTSTQNKVPIKQRAQNPPTRKGIDVGKRKKGLIRRLGAVDWGLVLRVSALLFTLGLLILILYYETTVGVDTGFERFMNSQTVGVRILFAVFGILINGFWNWYFAATFESQIHSLLAKRPRPAKESILLSPPSNVFVGLFRSTRYIKEDHLSFHIALATFFAKFTPILLSNIPFSNAVTWKIHEACTWIAVGLLLHMVLVLTAAVVFVPLWEGIAARRRRVYRLYYGRSKVKELMPLGTDTVVGCMYYVYDSSMVGDFEGLSVMGRGEKVRLVVGMEKLYWFGRRKVAVTSTGNVRGAQERVGVDYV